MPLLSIRHYQPRTGLFIARDPVLTEPRYQYVGGVPTERVDASGEAASCFIKYYLEGKGLLIGASARMEVDGRCYINHCGCYDWICDVSAELHLVPGSAFGAIIASGYGYCSALDRIVCPPASGGYGGGSRTPVSPFPVGRLFDWLDLAWGAGIGLNTGIFWYPTTGGVGSADVSCFYAGACAVTILWGVSGALEVASSTMSCWPRGAPWLGPPGGIPPSPILPGNPVKP
jgi:hypothetical protein